jgi:hypothetical protein
LFDKEEPSSEMLFSFQEDSSNQVVSTVQEE